jgi:hypothetical protein
METRQSTRPKTLADLKDIQAKVAEAREVHSKDVPSSDSVDDGQGFVPFSELSESQKAELTSLEVATAQPGVEAAGGSSFIENPPEFILLAVFLLFFFLIKRL